ncbi:MAG: tRNA dihydrouridine synthase DusB [Christensenellales bacterium]
MQIGGFVPDNEFFLAPMAGVTDGPFRALCAAMGCGLTYTEMASAKGLFYGGTRTRELLQGTLEAGLYGVQIFGREPALMADMAREICEDGQVALVDINMGCPAPKITGNGEGSALAMDLPQAARVISAVAKACPAPVTVKMRKGWDGDRENARELARIAQDCGAAAVTIHGRTRQQFYSGKADWDIIRQIKETVSIPVIGNGDVFCASDAFRMMEQTGCDAVMVARGAQGNPFIFEELAAMRAGRTYLAPSGERRLEVAIGHARELVASKGERRGIREMRKHMSWYCKGLKGAAAFRVRVNRCESYGELEELVGEYAAFLRDAGEQEA